MHVTYDLRQNGEKSNRDETRGAQEFELPHPVEITHWKVGEFEDTSGTRVHGVRVDYSDHEGTPGSRWIEIPRFSMNVRIYEGDLPLEYLEALEAQAA